MRLLLTLFTIALLSVGVIACGGASKGVGSATQTTNVAATAGSNATNGSSNTSTSVQSLPSMDRDDDRDSSGKGRYDSDDYKIVAYGHEATPADRRAVTALVKRFYAAAAAGNGAGACSMFYTLLAESIVEGYGRVPGSPALRGNTCAVVMSKLFKQNYQELVVDNATLAMTGVRVEGKRGIGLLSFKGRPEQHIVVHREFGTWKIDSMLDSRLL
jgi:hypothetical protein